MKPLPKQGGTRLATIPKHQIFVECACGHKCPVPVPVLIERWGDLITVGEAIGKLRCSHCGLKQISEYRLIYQGGSWAAMQGAEQGQRKPPPE